jgi:uncharacterized protein (DUF1330 family)
MSVYMIIEAKEVWDREMYGKYIEKVPAIVEKFGGKYLARGGAVTVISGDWTPGRVIIIRFESMDRFNDWWNSPEYKAVTHLRENAARVNAIVVEGV